MRFLLALFVPLLATAAIWPENIGAWRRASVGPVKAAGPLWNEYGFKEGETARYESGARSFTATAWRLHDSTAALGAFEWQRPADAKPSRLLSLAAATKDGVLLAQGNYLLQFLGYQPAPEEVNALVAALPRREQAPLPSLPDYLPQKDLVPNSERYVLGPAGLAEFAPGIPPSVAAFHMDAEGQLAVYHTSGGDLKLAVFNYPTPQIAQHQVGAFAAIPGVLAKRTGPLVALILSPPNADAAERLLSLIRYSAAVTMNERVPTRKDNIGDLVINAFVLIGFLLAFMTVSGLAYGALRLVVRRSRAGVDGEALIVLDLRDRR